MASIERITINGWTAFESVSVHAAFNEAARSFTATLAAELGASTVNRIFDVGTEVSISTNGELLVTGHIDTKEPRFSARQADITITGRSKSGDLVDGAAEHDTGYFENKDPLEIANEISKEYGAKWESDQKLEKIEQYKLQQGETCYRCIEKMARQQGMTITGTKEGNAKITKAGSQRQGGSLVEGVNILRGQASHNGKNRHSKIIVRGQRPFGHGDENLEIEAEEMDGAIKRHRSVIIIQDEDTTKERAKKRAKNRKDRAAGNALKATITVQGFHDDGGQLWEPGNLVWTESEFLDIAQDMLIESVDYEQSNSGSLCTLNLVDPRAYGGGGGGGGGAGNKSGSSWDFG
ncbi:phage baseplate assembly protein [Bradyrhizobium cenepequi]